MPRWRNQSGATACLSKAKAQPVPLMSKKGRRWVGGGNNEPLSDKLAQSKGVICPPAGIDLEMQVRPPGGGALKVVPPQARPAEIPGSSRGNSQVR